MSKILATVGGMPITEEDVDSFLAGLGQRGQSYNNPEGRKVVLEQLIGNKLLLLDAKRNLIEAEPAFKAQLARLKDNLLAGYAAEKVISAVTVSDKDARDFYDANPDKFLSEETVNASHILVETEEQARELIARLQYGASFEELAAEHSSCPSKANGGNLGDFGKGQMVPEFDKAVFEMEVGAISAEPVATQFGYHIIKLNSKSEASVMAFEEIAEEIKRALLAEKQQKAYESKINQLKILYPVDKTI